MEEAFLQVAEAKKDPQSTGAVKENSSRERQEEPEKKSLFGSGNGWNSISSWLSQTVTMQNISEQSSSFIKACKDDIKEFYDVMNVHVTETTGKPIPVAEAKALISKATEKTDTLLLKPLNSVVSKISNKVAQTVSDVLYSDDEDEKANDPVLPAKHLTLDDPMALLIHNILSDPNVILNEPVNLQDFSSFLDSAFDLNEKTQEISGILATYDEFRSFHGSVVPLKIPFGDFWKRFFYIVYLEKERDRKRREIMESVAAIGSTDKNGEDIGLESGEEQGWDTEPTMGVSKQSVGSIKPKENDSLKKESPNECPKEESPKKSPKKSPKETSKSNNIDLDDDLNEMLKDVQVNDHEIAAAEDWDDWENI